MTLDPLSLALGLLTGLAYPRLYELVKPLFAAPQPLRLSDRVTFEALTATIEPPHRLSQWKIYTHAFILRGEMCQRGPLNVREMRELTGLSYRQQVKYISVLRGAIVDVIPSGGVRWRVGKGARRALIPALPFPRDFDPPPFGTLDAVQLQHRGTVQRGAER